MTNEKTIHPSTETPDTYTYCGVTAPLALWIEVGLETSYSRDTTTFPYRPNTNTGVKSATDGEIIEARLHTGDTGELALVWLIGERRRQREERARIGAMDRASEAQKKAGDDAIHAARIKRQEAEIRAKIAGVRIDSVFQ